jgi:hypothetical protein
LFAINPANDYCSAQEENQAIFSFKLKKIDKNRHADDSEIISPSQYIQVYSRTTYSTPSTLPI